MLRHRHHETPSAHLSSVEPPCALTSLTYREFLPDEAATRALAGRLAPRVSAGLIAYLCGELGAGKTSFVRGLLLALGHTGKVKSPTYTLVELYNLSRLCFYHFDFYRFADSGEWIDAGFRDYFGRDCACFVEWPERAGVWLPAPDLEIHLMHAGQGRQVELVARSERGSACLAGLTTLVVPPTPAGAGR